MATNPQRRRPPDPRHGRRQAVPAASAGTALTLLRLFLGVTFVYAGVQKLSDPGFLHAGSSTYIGTQLRGFAHGTPGGFLLRTFAIPHPKLAGVAVALVEIAVGLLATMGLLTRIAAAVGLSLNLILFLTNSWHAYPYFLGSDIVFVFAWLPFVLAGSDGQVALDHSLDRLARSPRMRLAPVAGAPALTRRQVLTRALGLTGFAALSLGGIAALAKGPYRGATRTLGARATATPKAAPTTHHANHTQPSHPSGVPSNAVKLGSSSQLPAGQAATYNDPGDGNPDIVIREPSGKIAAFSAVCTHAGCTVEYQSGQLVCPCHGGVYSAQTGAVVSGPPPQALAQRTVVESGGDIYAVPA